MSPTSARSAPCERRTPVIVTTEAGVRIAIVSGTYSLNGFPPPAGHEWSVSMWDARHLIAQARAAKRAGADIVIAKYHGGDEYSAMPNAQQVALARALTGVAVRRRWSASTPTSCSRSRRSTASGWSTGWATRWRRARSRDRGPTRGSRSVHVPRDPAPRVRGGPGGVRADVLEPLRVRASIRVQRVVQALARGVGDAARLREALAATRASVNLLGHPSGLVLR